MATITTRPFLTAPSNEIGRVSTRLLTWAIDTEHGNGFLNPDNKNVTNRFDQTVGKVIRFFLRLIVGAVVCVVGGALGVIRHAWGIGASIVQLKGEDALEHLGCFLGEIWRISVIGTFHDMMEYAAEPHRFSETYQQANPLLEDHT